MPLNEEWRKLATKQLKGADPEEKLTWHTAEVGSATCGETAKQRQYHCLVIRVCLQFQHGIEEKVLITCLILENTFLKRGQSHCYHICDIRCNCRYLRFSVAKLLQLLVSSRLDYCNSSFRNIALVDITKLQHVQNYLARVYVNLCVNKIQNEDNIIVVILTSAQLSWPVVGQSPQSGAFRSVCLVLSSARCSRHSNHMTARAHLTTSSITNYYKKHLSTSFNYN